MAGDETGIKSRGIICRPEEEEEEKLCDLKMDYSLDGWHKNERRGIDGRKTSQKFSIKKSFRDLGVVVVKSPATRLVHIRKVPKSIVLYFQTSR